jgi:hypothetical protein
MHFTYCEDATSDLQQGDILNRTPAINAVLNEVHPHYANNSSNRYYIVLTQSCDLVQGRGDPCTSRYISIAPVRPLSLVIERETARLAEADLVVENPVCTSRAKSRLTNFLERIFNNNETNYFYLHQDPTMAFPESCCAFLRLSIAIRAKEHYQTCLTARVLGLDESFRAKLGWLVGNLYSRVGTEDWPQSELTDLIKRNLENAAIWVDDRMLRNLRTSVGQWKQTNPGRELDSSVLRILAGDLKSRKEEVLERLRTLLFESEAIRSALSRGVISEVDMKKLVDTKIKNDPTLTTLLK